MSMGKSTKKTSISKNSTTYIESPLKQMITATLIKIVALKEKYPSSKQDSPEKCHADKLVTKVETLLETVHKSLLPTFDKQNLNPNSVAIVKTLIDFKNLRNELHTRKYTLFQAVNTELPAIIKATAKKHPLSITNIVLQTLQEKKDTFFKTAETIPGISLDILFEEIKHAIEDLALDEQDLQRLSDKKQVKSLLKTLDKILFKSINDKYTFTIAHPITFELAELMAKIINQAPKELAELAPFFNPQSLNMDWHSGIKGPVNRKLLGYSFILKPQANKKTTTPSYTYNFTRLINGKLETTKYDGASYYRHYSSLLLSTFLYEMNNYFSNFADTTHAKSEFARVTLLQRFVKAESESIAASITEHITACKQNFNKEPLGTVTFIHTLDKEFTQNQSLLLGNKRLKNELIQKGVLYKLINVSTLLNNYPELACQLKKDANEKLDIAYSDSLLPDELIKFESETSKIVASKNHLDSLIDEQIITLQKVTFAIEKKLLAYSEKRQKAVAAWRQNSLNSSTKATDNQLILLENYSQTLNDIPDSSEEPLVDDNINSLTEAINSITHKSQQRQVLKAKLKCLLQEVEKSSRLLPEEVELDTDKTLLAFKIKLSEPVIEHALGLIKQIESKQVAQHKKLYALQTQLEQIKLNALFSETQLTIHSEKIKPLLLKTNKKIEIIQQKQVVLTDKNERTQSSISLQNRVLTDLLAQKSLKTLSINNLDIENQLLIQGALKFTKNNQSQTVNPTTSEEELLKHNSFFDRLIEDVNKQSDVLEFKNTISLFKEIFDFNSNKKINLRAQLLSIEAQSEKYAKSLGITKQQYEAQFKEANRLATDIEQLKSNEKVLISISDIFEDIIKLNALIESFKNSEQKPYTDESLFQGIFGLKQAQSLLLTKTEKLSQEIKELGSSPHQANLLAISKLLDSTEQNITAAIQFKLDLSPLKEQISTYKTSCTQLHNTFYHLTNDPTLTPFARFKQLKELISHYNTLSDTIGAQKIALDKVTLNLAKVDDKHNHKKMEKIVISQEELHKNVGKLGELLMTSLTVELLTYKQEADVFSSWEHSIESTATHNANSLKLAAIKQQLTNVPSDEELHKLAKFIDICFYSQDGSKKLEKIKQCQKDIEEQLLRSERANDALLQRITERKALVDTLLLTKLNAYEEKRKKSYKIKDALSSNDIEMRTEFINKIKMLLLEYKQSGDSSVVIKTIEQDIAKFPGIKLQAILNKIIIELIEADLKIPTDYNNTSTAKADVETDHKNAITVLKNLMLFHPKYVAAINTLYRQIAAMRHYGAELTRCNDSCGEVATRLADKLEHDVDRFVIAYPTALPTTPTYTQFEENLIRRLHSEDDAMSKHRAPWKQIIANVVIGLCSVGIALGIKLFYSKLSTGRCSFFFDQTHRQEKIASLEESLHKFTASAA